MSERATNLPALLPSTRDSLPHVTVAMLLDSLAEYEKQSTPPQERQGEPSAGFSPLKKTATHTRQTPPSKASAI